MIKNTTCLNKPPQVMWLNSTDMVKSHDDTSLHVSHMISVWIDFMTDGWPDREKMTPIKLAHIEIQ